MKIYYQFIPMHGGSIRNLFVIHETESMITVIDHPSDPPALGRRIRKGNFIFSTFEEAKKAWSIIEKENVHNVEQQLYRAKKRLERVMAIEES